jgi:signal transduction histidine kinase
LGASIARHRVRTALIEAKETLEQRVLERTRELREQIEAKDRAHAELATAQQRLIEFSREAGMAEIATSVLHNVGNVLNSVNVSASLVAGKVRESRVDNLVALIHMLEQHNGNLTEFLANDPKGQRVLPYLAKLGRHLQSERNGLLKELESLSSHVGHIKQIVATQQNYAKVSGLVENISLSEVVDDALGILEVGLVRHEIKLERKFEILPTIAADKHQILQILLNLLRNAKQAIKQAEGKGGKVIRVSIRRLGKSRVSLAVEDTGVGLPPENLTRIFGHGFTTKADGHGFGLHSCALAASQMGGSLRAESEGLGRGATFILELPIKTGEEIDEKSLT